MKKRYSEEQSVGFLRGQIGRSSEGALPKTRFQRRINLCLAEQVWRDRCLGSQAVEGPVEVKISP